MIANAWFFYALTASVCWGLAFVVSEKLLNQGFTPAFIMFFSTGIAFPMYLFLSWKLSDLKGGFNIISSNSSALWMLVLISLTTVGANFLILMSVDEKNATLTALIESTYPIFTLFFAWLLLKDMQITWETAAGGVMILLGASLIYFKG